MLLALTAVNAFAQVETPLKIGYINANLVIELAPQGMQAFEQLQQEFAQRQQRLEEIEDELGEVQTQLQNSAAANLSQDEMRALRNRERALSRDVQRSRSELNEDFNYRRNEELDRLQQFISDVIVRMAEEQNFDLIVQSPVVWASERINITDDVVEELQRMFNQ